MRFISPALLILALTMFAPLAQATDCTYGYSTFSATTWDDVLVGDSFAYLIDPVAEGCGNGIGLDLTDITFRFGVQSGGSIDMQANLLEAVEIGPGCYAPGVAINTTPVHHVTDWPDVGGLGVTFRDDFTCVPADRPYFISVDIVGLDAEMHFPRTAETTTCKSYMNRGAGFIDLQGFEGGGGLIIDAYSDNCLSPVGTEEMNWGDVKGMWR
jgi:hypothetical protein